MPSNFSVSDCTLTNPVASAATCDKPLTAPGGIVSLNISGTISVASGSTVNMMVVEGTAPSGATLNRGSSSVSWTYAGNTYTSPVSQPSSSFVVP